MQRIPDWIELEICQIPIFYWKTNRYSQNINLIGQRGPTINSGKQQKIVTKNICTLQSDYLQFCTALYPDRIGSGSLHNGLGQDWTISNESVSYSVIAAFMRNFRGEEVGHNGWKVKGFNQSARSLRMITGTPTDALGKKRLQQLDNAKTSRKRPSNVCRVCCKGTAHGHWAPGPYSLRDTGPIPRRRGVTSSWVSGPVSLKLYGPGAQWPYAILFATYLLS